MGGSSKVSKEKPIPSHSGWTTHEPPLWRWHRQLETCDFFWFHLVRPKKHIEPLGPQRGQQKLFSPLTHQFLTFKKLCWLVRSNINKNPMASLKNAVVRLRNLPRKHSGQFGKLVGRILWWQSDLTLCPFQIWTLHGIPLDHPPEWGGKTAEDSEETQSGGRFKILWGFRSTAGTHASL